MDKNRTGVADEEVDRIRYRAAGGILYWHKTHRRRPGKNGIEYGINRWAGQKIGLLAKTLPRKNSGKCALGAKIGDFAHVRINPYQTFLRAQTCMLLRANLKKRLLRAAGVARVLIDVGICAGCAANAATAWGGTVSAPGAFTFLTGAWPAAIPSG